MSERDLQKLLKEKERELTTARELSKNLELARATRPSNMMNRFNPTSVYSLSASGVVRQGMTFHDEEDEYSHGSGWNVKTVGMSVEEFKTKYTELEFKVIEHDKPMKINYEKPVRCDGSQEPIELDELQVRARVLELKLAGYSYKQIAVELEWGDDLDAARRVAKVMREAMKS